MTSSATKAPHLDVRQIYAQQRRPLILGRFDDLAPGEALLLLDDHDPKPLLLPVSGASPRRIHLGLSGERSGHLANSHRQVRAGRSGRGKVLRALKALWA